jgi:peptide/nickel transport system substrate-binding protein/microcin C transport system substrate-binding protein
LTDLVFETLAVYDLDELHVEYGLLAEDIAVAPDFSSATFRLHAEATFSNGDSVTARDVKYSFDTLNGPKASPRFRSYFTDIDNRGELDPAVFGPMRRQPSTSPPGSYRANLREAARLFAEAGWRNRGDGVLRNDKGEPFVLRVSGSPSLLEAFYLNVKRLGVEVVYRNGDPAVDRENLRNFDFDFTSIALRESRDPGPELLRAFSSQEADVPGSENLLGLKSPAVDFLIGRILDAQSEHDLETAAHAFDRVMVAQAYVLPWRWLKNHYVMYNRRLKRPPTLPLYYGATEWALADWWDGSVEGR